MEKLPHGTLYNFSPLGGFVIPGNLASEPEIDPMLSLLGLLLFSFQLMSPEEGCSLYLLVKNIFLTLIFN